MSRCPLSISPSMPIPGSIAAQLLLQASNIDDVPVFGKPSVLDAPDVDGAPRDPPASRRKALDGSGVGRAQHRSRNNLVVAEDTVFDAGLEIRPVRENLLI